MSLGQWIAATRKSQNMSQRTLAKKSGVSQPTISAIESGTKAPSIITIQYIADALGVSLQDIVEERNGSQIKKEAAAQECDSLRREVIDLYDSLSDPGKDRALSYLRFLSEGEKKR